MVTTGTRFGSYEVLGALGAGGMGEVYRARDTKLKRDVALKILPERFAEDPERLARFRREAEALASLNHPNIAAIYGLDDATGTHVIVLELVDGPTLAERIERGPLPLVETWPLAMQLIEALMVAHEKGIVHRDFKPANVKIAADGRIKILDFGIAKVFAAAPDTLDASESPTNVGTLAGSAGMILGTAAYMSPEQARGKAVDARADIWAFGCVLFEMLTGRPAFAGDTITDILSTVIKNDPEWAALPHDTPAAIHRLLRRCLTKDPNQRLHAIADARLDIADSLNDTGVGGTVGGPSHSVRLPWIVAGAALVAALALSIVTFRSLRTRPPAPVDAPELRLEVNTPPTTDPISMAISPDGRRLTFVATSDGAPRLWLRPLDVATAQPLAGTEGASYPFWSPDSRSIGFFAGGKLKRLDIGGGQPQTLTNVAGARGGSWNSDGVILLAVGSNALWRMPASGGTPAPVTQLASHQTNHRFPHFLPDGRHFLFFSQGSGETQGIYLATLDSPETTRLTAADAAAAYVPPGYLLFVRRGTLLAQRLDVPKRELVGDPVMVADPVGWDGAIGIGAFSVSATGVVAHRASGPGRRQLVWFDRAGRQVGVVGSADENSLQYPELSNDGSRIAIDRTVQNNRDIYVVDVGRGGPRRLTFDANIDATPVWAPNGGRLVFRSSRNGVYDLYEKSSTLEGTESLLYGSPEAKTPNDRSPDGQLLLYTHQDPKGLNDLFVLPVDRAQADRTPKPFVQTPFDDSQGVFSPDGGWVAYQSNEGGPLEVYVQPFPGPGGKQQISTAGGASPRWRPEGGELFFLSPEGTLMAVSIRSQGSTLELGTQQALFQTRLTGPFSGVAGNIRPQYDAAPGGRFLMNITAEETVSPITIILNWKPR